MPTLEVTTKSAEQVWKSPDGQRVIYKVTLDYNGQTLSAKTYSQAIATEGWSGTIESYEKEGRNGAETFVKQPQKENPGYSGGVSRGGGGYAPRDDSHIKAQWAIGQAMTFQTAVNTDGNAKLDDVEELAVKLFAMVDRVKSSTEGTGEAVPDEVHDPAQVSIEELNVVLGGEILPEDTETPWPKS